MSEINENLEEYAHADRIRRSYANAIKNYPPSVRRNNEWKTVIDFTEIAEGGIPAEEVLSRL